MQGGGLLRSGEGGAGLGAVAAPVRGRPAKSQPPGLLLHLAAATGAWERAKTQLDVALGMDKDTMLMVRVYGDAIQCEEERRKAFEGEVAPTIFGDPQPWMAELFEALRLDRRGEHAAAAALRERALDAAPAT